MEAPLLLDERKFDIRIWVLLTQDSRLFMFKEGYIRTTSSAYTLDKNSITSPEIHLTNQAVQQKLKDYGKFENGNQLTFD